MIKLKGVDYNIPIDPTEDKCDVNYAENTSESPVIFYVDCNQWEEAKQFSSAEDAWKCMNNLSVTTEPVIYLSVDDKIMEVASKFTVSWMDVVNFVEYRAQKRVIEAMDSLIASNPNVSVIGSRYSLGNKDTVIINSDFCGRFVDYDEDVM